MGTCSIDATCAMATRPWTCRILPILSVAAIIVGLSPLGAFAQAPWQEYVTDDPTPIPYQIGEEWLSIPANCIIDIPPFLESQKWTEEEHSIQFFWPSLTCLTEERLEDFRNPTTEDLIRVLTSGDGGRAAVATSTFGIFIGSIEGASKYTFDEETFEMGYDDATDMYVRHTLFIDQKIDLLVDRDHDLRSITRFLRCGEGDWFCRWFGQVLRPRRAGRIQSRSAAERQNDL